MAKSNVTPPAKEKAAQSAAEVELVPDAWERFEKAVDKVAKSPPQHRAAAPAVSSSAKIKKEKP